MKTMHFSMNYLNSCRRSAETPTYGYSRMLSQCAYATRNAMSDYNYNDSKQSTEWSNSTIGPIGSATRIFDQEYQWSRITTSQRESNEWSRRCRPLEDLYTGLTRRRSDPLVPCRTRPLWRYETIQHYQHKISHQKTFSPMPTLSIPRQLLHVQTTSKGVW